MLHVGIIQLSSRLKKNKKNHVMKWRSEVGGGTYHIGDGVVVGAGNGGLERRSEVGKWCRRSLRSMVKFGEE